MKIIILNYHLEIINVSNKKIHSFFPILLGIVQTPMAIIVNSIIVKLNPQIHSLNK